MSHTQKRAELNSAIRLQLTEAFAHTRPEFVPFHHWTVTEVFPAGVTAELRVLPFAAPDLGGLSGKRELHNDQRHYFNRTNNARFAICGAIAEGFQSAEVVAAIERATGADLKDSFVRLEFAQDVDGFWLAPHTDLGVKRFTMLIYLAEGETQADLGTDLYAESGAWRRRSQFTDNTALVFVPGDNTWHGLERREISGVRRSLVMNYVTSAWRERGQLAFPETPVRS